MRSQFEAFSRQLPLLYLILVINSLAVAFTHIGKAPALLCEYIPFTLCVACVVRLWIWSRRRKLIASLNDRQIARRLTNTIWLIVLLGGLFTAWGLSLYRYGDAYEKAHVAFYMSITVIGCIFCLMHMRTAALLLTGIVLIPFALYFSTTGNPVLIAIAVNMVLVSIAMIKVLLTYYRDFSNLARSQIALEQKQHELEALNAENHRLANADSLTGLPNRRHFLSLLADRFESGPLPESRFAVGIIDLDGFKQVNDLHGHGAGDSLLEEVGRRLLAFSNAQLLIARLGGDEFGLLIRSIDTEQQLLDVGSAICHALRKPYELLRATARISASIGIAMFPEAGRTSEQLFERADYALYYGKENRRGHTTIFSGQHESRIREFGSVEQALRQADLEKEMVLHYQPIVDVRTREIRAYEALARWHSPVLGDVAPNLFIRVAEKSDLIHQVTAVLLGKALAYMTQRDRRIHVSFNLSARDIASPEAVEKIRETVRKSRVDAGRLTFEITETAVVQDFEQGRAALSELKALGAKISLDDFGTGYSSLHYIHQLPLNNVKVDRSFVEHIAQDTAAQGIVRSIVELCRNLGLTCVIEGVETDEQVAVLQRLGCTFMQGYHFGKPAPFETVQSQQFRNATAAITGTQTTSGIAKIGNSA
ncbi:putative bifunctional diguanylate cyclase/phosphodiesterase [Trinickia violacea]|nr:EAL domain-containing protein [Trinickia violacea]